MIRLKKRMSNEREYREFKTEMDARRHETPQQRIERVSEEMLEEVREERRRAERRRKKCKRSRKTSGRIEQSNKNPSRTNEKRKRTIAK